MLRQRLDRPHRFFFVDYFIKHTLPPLLAQMGTLPLNNKEAKRELKGNLNNKTLPFCSEPKYYGVTLDRSLTYRRHLESLRKKLSSCVAILRQLAGAGWSARARILRISTLALVHSTARILLSCIVPQCSYSPHWPCHQVRLANCYWMPASYTCAQPSYSCRHTTSSCLHKWGMASSAARECGAEEQIVDHVVLQCPTHRPPHGLHSLTVLDDETIEWLLNTCPSSSAAKQWIVELAKTTKKIMHILFASNFLSRHIGRFPWF